jgi:hypothetical protein
VLRRTDPEPRPTRNPQQLAHGVGDGDVVVGIDEQAGLPVNDGIESPTDVACHNR